MDEPAAFVAFEDQILLSGTALGALMRDVLARGKVFRFRAKGSSMSPFILNGDLISISPLFNTPPAIGEVVAFVDTGWGKLVVHRIVSKTKAGYLIKGDNQIESTDGIIPLENILGRLTAVEREGKGIRLGFGPEKSLIAFLSRKALLKPFLSRLAPLIRPFR